MLYTVLKFIHVGSIAVWFGGMVTMLILNRLLVRAGDASASHALGRQGQRISQWLFMPAVLLTLITGIGMVQTGQLGFGSPWIVWGMVGLVLSVFIGAALTGGAARKLAGQVARGEVDAAGVARAQRRIMAFAVLNIALLLSIIWAMVAKPG